MDSAKIVIGEVQAVSGPKVVPLFTEGVRESGEAAHLHSDGEVLAFDNRCADAARIRTAHNWDHLRAGDFRRSVPCFAVARRSIHLDDLGEVATVAEGRCDGGTVRSEPIASDLEMAVRSRVP